MKVEMLIITNGSEKNVAEWRHTNKFDPGAELRRIFRIFKSFRWVDSVYVIAQLSALWFKVNPLSMTSVEPRLRVYLIEVDVPS